MRTETIQIKVTQEQKTTIENFIKWKSTNDEYHYTVSSFLLTYIMNMINKSQFMNSGSL